MIYPIYFISCTIFKIMLFFLCKLKVIGRENYPKRGPFIIAANHASFADPPVLGVTHWPAPIIFMAKKELFETFILGLWFKSVGCIPVYRNSRSFGPLKQGLENLKQGKILGIFPEGTRSANGELSKAELGIGFLAYKSKAPVIPLYIQGTDKVLPKGQKFIRPHQVNARVGKAVDISECLKYTEKEKIYESIGEKVMAAISRLKDEEKNSCLV